MENILLPSKMTFVEGDKEHESILTIEPLHHGYGTTIGNALRRVMLSSLEGAAVTAVKIKGVRHEFSSLEGVKEDILEIILNLKRLRMKVYSSEPITLKLEMSGETVVTGADIQPNADVEIINSDLVLANLTSKDASLVMEITVGRGRGFVPTEEREASGEIGVIAVDSMFSPVVNVGVKVENTRVGEITNYDKAIITILTDGTLAPQEAVDQATKVILNHFSWIDGQLANAALTEKIESAKEEKVEEGLGAAEDTYEEVPTELPEEVENEPEVQEDVEPEEPEVE
ncbi:MAG: DNA-directed RNA polymerase subunit alpha [Patescibacteria group bacterium]